MSQEKRGASPIVVKPNMAQKRALYIRWLFACAFGAILAASFNIAGYFADIEGLQSEDIGLAHEVEVAIEKVPSGRATTIGFRENDSQILFTCYVGYWGYDGWRRDIGKKAKIWVLNGKVAQIQVDGEIRRSLNDIRSAMQKSLYFGIGLGSLGVGLMLLGIVKFRRKL